MEHKKMQEAINKFNLSVSEVIAVPDSYSSQVSKIVLESGEKLIIKIPYNRKKLLKEISVLNLLKDKILVPKVIDFFDDGSDGNGALLLSYLDGYSIIGEVSEDISYQMGALLGNLHSVRGEYFGEIQRDETDASKKGWWEIMFDYFQEWIPFCEKVLPKEILNKCIEHFMKLYEDLPNSDGPCVVHLDFRPGNILIKDGKIVGLIDFESARYGSADIDFTKIKNTVWDKDIKNKEAFLNGYGLVRKVPDIERTLPFYLLYEAFAGVGWCVKRGKLDDSFLIENIERMKLML